MADFVAAKRFGRIAYYAGASRVDLKHLSGHESVDRAAHYVGWDGAQGYATVGRFESATAEALTAGA